MTNPVVIGNATLYLGDCRDILPTLGKVDAVITDPPYGVGLTTKNSYRDIKKASVLYQDDPETIRALIKSAMPAILAKSDRAVVFPGARMLWEYPEPAALGAVFTMAGAGTCSWGFQCTHPVLFYGRDPFLADGKGSRPNSRKDDLPNREAIDHPCPKPVSWMKWAVDRASRPEETICDPFMGSGTTGVACAKLGRKFIGIEISPHYFAIACRRIEDAQRQGDMFLTGAAQ